MPRVLIVSESWVVTERRAPSYDETVSAARQLLRFTDWRKGL